MEQKEQGLNEAQLDFLRLLGHIKTKEELDELRQVVCDFYAKKVDEGMDKLWAEGKWNEQTIKNLENAHLRTPYKNDK